MNKWLDYFYTIGQICGFLYILYGAWLLVMLIKVMNK